MKKATDEIQRTAKNVDLIIEVLDARAMNATSNPVVHQLNKPVLQIALKNDLALKGDNSILTGSLKNKGFRNEIIRAMDQALAAKIERYKAKRLLNPKFLVMVVGLPNVGKSSLINFLKQKKHLITENRPGVTKKQTTVPVNERYFLVDTPGVLFKNIDRLCF